MAALLHYGAHMFKVTYQRGPWHADATAQPPPDGAEARRRRLQAHNGQEHLRRAHKRQRRQQQQAGGAVQQAAEVSEKTGGDSSNELVCSSTCCRRCLNTIGRQIVSMCMSVSRKGQKAEARHSVDAWRGDLSGQLRPWVVDAHSSAAEDLHPATAADATPAADVGQSTTAARVVQQQQQEQRQRQQQQWQQRGHQRQPFLVWVAVSSEALASFETSGYRPRGALLQGLGFPPLWLPAALEQVCAYTFAVSAALALLNMLPLGFLDGGAALGAALEMRRWEAGPLTVAGCDPGARSRVRILSARAAAGLGAFVLASHALRLAL